MIKEHGIERVLRMIELLPKTNLLAGAPIITTPWQLEEKMATLKAFLQRPQFRSKLTPNYII